MVEHKSYKTILKKDSPYLGEWDLPDAGDGDLVLTIKDVREGSIIGENGRTSIKVIITFEENVKPFACNKTNGASISKALKSRYMDEWVGKKIQLYRSKNIKFGSESGIWGIRVRDYAPKVEGEKCFCSVCGKEITKKLYDGTIAKYGKPYCSEECLKASTEGVSLDSVLD